LSRWVVKGKVQCDGKITPSPTCFSGHMKMRYPYRMLCTIVNAGRLLAKHVGTLALIILMCSNASPAYSVLTHEEIVDLLWTDDIRPLLLKRFPGLSEDQIKDAHAYAYGGAVIQDLGYYPFGSTEFSSLVHYVRSGDFVRELLLESGDVNEYAFALGALSHYAADIAGHPAVNKAVAIEYPKLQAKFGKSVRYAQDKTAHLKTEFGFDTLQVAKNRYASEQYHNFIGFQVSKSLLERVFPVVYGVELKDVLTHEDLAVGSYRFSVGRLIPQMTQVALQTHKKNLMHETPNFAKRKFLYRLSRSDYEKEWGKDYVKPGIGTRILSTLLRYMPRIGPFKGLGFNNPTPQTEDLYIKSINATVDQYRIFLTGVRTNSLTLANCDFDTGEPTKAAEYSLTDETYAKLLAQLSDRKFDRTSPELRANILEFYSDLSAAIETKKDNVRWQSVLKSLDQLKAAAPGAIVADDLASRSVLEPTTKVTGPHQRLTVGGVSDPIGLPNSVSETQQ
jgi:Zinc dependent phospholipase C